MKLLRPMSWLLILSLLATMAVTFAVADIRLYGDADGDEKISAGDALTILRHVVGKSKLEGERAIVADVSGTDGISAQDALLILQYVVGKIKVFPAEELAVLGENLKTVPQLIDTKSFATPIAPVEINEAFNTLTQINQAYSPLYDLDVDCVLAYVYGFNHGAMPSDWVENKTSYGDTDTIGIMIAVNRDNGEYLGLHPERGMKDVQTKFDGTYRQHSAFGDTPVYYMVPTDPYLEYKWEVIDSYLKTGHVKVVALEEPELWNNTGYSQGYQEAYEAHFGEDWEDFDLNADAMWKNQFFKAYMFKHAFEVLSRRIKESYPDVSVLITAHSGLSYSTHGISTGLAMYADIDTIDGVIGQTWSDDASQAFPYGGKNISNIYMNAMYAYNSYGEALQSGQTLYLLQDPASDNGNLSAETKEENWRNTVVAAMMQNDTTSFQSTIWPQRAFQAAGMDYKTAQLNINRMFQEMHTLSGNVYSGTTGIALATSDSLGWHLNSRNVLTGNSRASVSGIYLSLLNDGIPVDTVCLDNLTDASQLADVNLLMVSYDAIKPLSEKVNQVLAQWVKEGGRLLYLGGHDGFTDITCEWWFQKETTPYNDLLTQLGLTDVITTVGEVRGDSKPVWAGSSFSDNSTINSQYCSRTITFDGSGFHTFITADGKNLGISADVGEGKAIFVGLPSSYYSLHMDNEMVVRELAAYALEGSDTPYYSADFFAAQRGDYFAYYSPNGYHKTAEDRTFVNLFSSNLDVVVSGTSLVRGEPVLLYDATEEDNDSIPRVGFTGGTEMAERVESATETKYTIAAPTSSVPATVLFGNGKFPQSVKAQTLSGIGVSVITAWDSYSDSLVVKANIPNVNDPVVFTVTWGDTEVELPTNYIFDSFTHFTKDSFDKDPLVESHTCHVNGGCYFCDLDTHVIWKIDLEQYIQASMTLDIFGNYKVEVSFDGANWKTVADWSQEGGPVGVLADGSKVDGASNRRDLTISANSYSEAGKYMYVKLGSCYMYTPEHPGGDHGGSVYNYTLTYLTTAK